MPACPDGPYEYGRALGRDYLDAVLLQRARSLGVTVLQPAKLLSVSGVAGCFECQFELRPPHMPAATQLRGQATLCAALVIDAHGSWEHELTWSSNRPGTAVAPRRSNSDLLAFKATFRDAGLLSGFLPVIAFNGGYGGMVKADHGRTTLACCIRRDALEKCRRDAPGETAGEAIEGHLRRCCHGIEKALRDAQRDGSWLSVGPMRPGVRVDSADPFLRVGNAAGETHPLIGEGIGMALQSASLLAAALGRAPTKTHEWKHFDQTQRTYAAAWRRQFASRLRIAQIYAHIAMSPALRPAATAMLTRLPQALTVAARMAGKAHPASRRRPLN
jgi:2-polyprenyl-6-methoxyphenol hydroxylase-like FAD-dependent oxidoreductase